MAALPEAENIDTEALRASVEAGETDLVCVLGPTASGKTRYAVSLARELAPAEILSADSRQVYRGMDIGTGKDLREYGEVPYHLIDIVPAGAKYNLYEYQRDFSRAYAVCRSRGAVPILCGGTGLYIEAATCGYELSDVPPDEEFRREMEKLSHEELRRRVLDLRPGTPEGVLQSRKRTIRALEVAVNEVGGLHREQLVLPSRTFYIGTLVSREERVERIDRRLDERLEEGLVEEVRGLLEGGVQPGDLIYYGLEYKFVTQYVTGEISFSEMRILLENAIHQFAKRQMTWFRGMERDGVRIHWVKV